MANILIVDDDPAVQIAMRLISERAPRRVEPGTMGGLQKPVRPGAPLAAVASDLTTRPASPAHCPNARGR